MNRIERERTVRDRLAQIARQGEGPVTYSEIGRWTGVPPVSVGPLVLDPINLREH